MDSDTHESNVRADSEEDVPGRSATSRRENATRFVRPILEVAWREFDRRILWTRVISESDAQMVPIDSVAGERICVDRARLAIAIAHPCGESEQSESEQGNVGSR
jgi:hypothetical protein